MIKIAPELPTEKKLLRPLNNGDLALGQQVLDLIGQYASYDGDGEAAIAAALGIYIKHRRMVGDDSARARLFELAEKISRSIEFKSTTDILQAEGGIKRVQQALEEDDKL